MIIHQRYKIPMPKVQADGLPLPQRYGAILTIVIGISMAVLDGAIANVALPTIAILLPSLLLPGRQLLQQSSPSHPGNGYF
ncbi:putative transport protein [Shigella sonnei]|nr:putative transport protein [Shigella sonnei]